MSAVTSIGTVPWSRQEMLDHLELFARLYERRPIRDNAGGMRSPHMFLAWFALQALHPQVIIESGVWLGQGTWFFEQACPDAALHCIDINLNRIQCRSARATYYNRDFSLLDWEHLPKDSTVLFFDDHQNALERVKTAQRFGFKHVIFEDNYPPSRGDCYSLKKVFSHAGFRPAAPAPRSLQERLGRLLNRPPRGTIPPNDADAAYLMQNLAVYYEFPPVFKAAQTRWNDAWDDEQYPTLEPLLHEVEQPYQQLYRDEAVHYTWMCYARLK